jgi:hypothetical protein
METAAQPMTPVRADQPGRPDELGQQLPAEDPVVPELLVAPLEDRRATVFSGGTEFEHVDKIVPPVGHTGSVSKPLRI